MSIAEDQIAQSVQTSRDLDPPPRLGHSKSGRLPLLLAAAALLAALGGAAMFYFKSSRVADGSILSFTAQRDSFDIRIPLNGEMKASRNVEIRNQVEGQTTIISLIPEGSRVKEGDELVTLASDAIKDRLEDSRIRVENALAATVNSQESVRIQEMQNESDIRASETNIALAKLEYEQFDKGDAKVQLETLNTALANAKTDLERKTKDRQQTEELAAKQFVSANDVLDAVIAERDSKNKLDTADLGLKVWHDYAEPRQRQTLQRKMVEAASELERIKARANARLLLGQADFRAKQSTQRVEEGRYKSLQEQLAACTIRAPQSGMVVYQTSVGGSQNQGPIEEGATVRLNQVLIQLPDTSKMVVEVRLAEQLTEKVKRGQEVAITVDAIPTKIFHGKVESIAVLPDSSNRWANPNLKEYLTQIAVDEYNAALKPGMSAKADILVERMDHVLAVPLQAIFSNGGQPYVFIGSADHFEKRYVTTGQSSATKMEIKEGLQPGEVVLLSRPKDAPEDKQGDGQSAPERKEEKGDAGSKARSNAAAAGGRA